MPSIIDQPPAYVQDDLDRLIAALDDPPANGGVPLKAAGQLLIATWNIRGFGRYTNKWRSTGNDSPKRDVRSLLFIATILERFDLIAIQELKTYTSALKEVLVWLNRNEQNRWDIVVSDVTRGDPGNEERLGYIYDRTKVDFSGLAGEVVIPYEEFTMRPERARRQFARTPYAVSFRADTGNNFILVSVHVNFSDTVLREFEVRQIAAWVDRWVREPHAWDIDILALGDFNVDRATNTAYQPFAQLLNVPTEMNQFPRTLYQAGKDKHYDMITWPVGGGGDVDGPSPNLVYTHTAGYFDFQPHILPSMTNTSLSWRVSDHYPLWVAFNVF